MQNKIFLVIFFLCFEKISYSGFLSNFLHLQNSDITIGFLNGNIELQKQIILLIQNEFTEKVNLNFKLIDSYQNAHIRIVFSENSYSYIGRQAHFTSKEFESLSVKINPTQIDLSFEDKLEFIHEFNHALGLTHEHEHLFIQNILQKNYDEVYASYLKKYKNGNLDNFNSNYMSKCFHHCSNFVFNQKSIMLYDFNHIFDLGEFNKITNKDLMNDVDLYRLNYLYPGNKKFKKTETFKILKKNESTLILDETNLKIIFNEQNNSNIEAIWINNLLIDLEEPDISGYFHVGENSIKITSQNEPNVQLKIISVLK